MDVIKLFPVSASLAILLPALRLFGAEPISLPDTLEKIKPAIVAVGTHQKTRRPPDCL
jgi:hypothetical protein